MKSKGKLDDVEKIISAVLVANKKSQTIGMPIVELEREYKEMECSSIPYRALGFPCLMDLLENMEREDKIRLGKRNTVTVVYLRAKSDFAHVSAMVSRQNDSRRKRTARGGRRFLPRNYHRPEMYNPPVLDSKMLSEVVKYVLRNPDGISMREVMEYVKDRIGYEFVEQHLINQLREVSHEIMVESEYLYPVTRKTATKTPNEQAASSQSQLTSPPACMYDDDDDDNGFENFAANTATTPYPPTNNNDINTLPQQSQVTQYPIDLNANSSRENDNCDVTYDEIGLLVRERVRFRLEKLIQKHPDGIWCAELPSLYQREYSIPLNYEELGFDSVNDFASYLPKIFHCVRPQDTGDFKLYDAQQPKPELNKKSERSKQLTLASIHNNWEKAYIDREEAVPDSLSLPVLQRLMPDGVMDHGETVPKIWVSGLFPTENSFLQVIVVDAVTPSFFWIQIQKNLKNFMRFMTELHEFYTLNASEYVIPIIMLERGLNCAALFENKWHRGIIKTVKPDNTVTIIFYDYGTEVTYSAEKIHFLHRSFSTLPAQAIPCGLYKVKPKSTSRWTYEVCKVFVDAVLEVPLYAMRGSIDEMNNSMFISLVDTQGVEDFHINDWMIDKGYAIGGEMGDTVNMTEIREEQRALSIINEETNDFRDLVSEQEKKIAELEKQAMAMAERENQQAMKIAELENQQARAIAEQAKEMANLKKFVMAVMVGGSTDNSVSKVTTANVEPSQTEAHQLSHQNTELIVIQSNFENLSIDDKLQELYENLDRPPIPPMPKNVSIVEDIKYNQYTNAHSQMDSNLENKKHNAQTKINFDLKNHDMNINNTRNGYNYSKDSSTPTITPQLYDLSHGLSSTNMKMNVALDSLIETPKTPLIENKLFERSIEYSFPKSSNPFNIDFGNDKFTMKNWSLSTGNPFASDFNITPSVAAKASKIPPPLPPRSFSMTASHGNNNWSEEKTENNVAAGWSLKQPVQMNQVQEENPSNIKVAVKQNAEIFVTAMDWKYFKEIYISTGSVHLINVDNEGWLVVEEFLLAFARDKISGKSTLVKILEMTKTEISFRMIERFDYPILFEELDRTTLAAPRSYQSRIKDSLDLIPVKSIFKLLKKLNIVSSNAVGKENRNFTTQLTALSDLNRILTIYKNLQAPS